MSNGLAASLCLASLWLLPCPGSLTLLQPLKFFLELSLLPGQRFHVVEADLLQAPQSLAESGFSLLGALPLQIKVFVLRSFDHVPLHPLHGLETIKRDSSDRKSVV